MKKTVGIIGARGHTGAELIRLIAGHPGLELVFVSSRELAGERVADHNPDFSGELRYENLDPEATASRGADAVILALPNGKGEPFVEALSGAGEKQAGEEPCRSGLGRDQARGEPIAPTQEPPSPQPSPPNAFGGEGAETGASLSVSAEPSRERLSIPLSPIPDGGEGWGEGASAAGASAAPSLGKIPVIIDLSADHRFDAAWYYGLPELTRQRYAGQRRISNPGCYATAMQLAIAPLAGELAGPPQCFGVSGYSGAGTTPSDKNDTEKLRDNLMPYALTDHIHEREVTAHLGMPVEFMPHVAPHFRGITMTVNLWLRQPMSREAVRAKYLDFYGSEPLVAIQDDAPWVSRIAGRHGAAIGGFTVSPDRRRVVVVATLDNLLKGAATQAMQNLNRALGFDELTGIEA